MFELRPLSVPELLDRSFSMFRQHFVLFVGIMAVPNAVGLLFTLPLNILQYTGGPRSMAGPELATAAVLVIAIAIAGLAFWILYMVALGAVTAAVAAIYRQQAISIRDAYAGVWVHAGSLLLLTLNVGLRIWLAFMLVGGAGFALSLASAFLIGPFGIVFMLIGMFGSLLAAGFLAMRYALSVPAMVLEDIGVSAALRRSVFLARGHMGRVFLILLCATIVTYASALLFQGPFLIAGMIAGPESTMALWLTVAGTVVGTIGMTATSPIMIIGLAVLYFDTRVRHEALDLQVMMQALDGAGGTPPAIAAPPVVS